MSDKIRYVLSTPEARHNAQKAVQVAESGYVVEIRPPTRTLNENAMFHALCEEFEKEGFVFAGKARTALEWKLILVSGHGVATGGKAEFILGLEGEWLDIRERTSRMSVRRMASLIEYTLAAQVELRNR